jgi:hypothetical protein
LGDIVRDINIPAREQQLSARTDNANAIMNSELNDCIDETVLRLCQSTDLTMEQTAAL